MWFNTEPRRAKKPSKMNGDTGSITTSSAAGFRPGTNKRIVLCFDGTDDSYDDMNSNVVDFFALLTKDDSEQVCYYQPGVGTYESPGMFSPLGLWFTKIMDEAFATYLPYHVMQGYQFLMQNYTSGDKVFLFGFSRGAYTARALAGMLYKVGLLPKDNMAQIPFAFTMYMDQTKSGITQAAGFKQTFCRSVTVDFLGVWETVASVGLLMTHNLPFSNSNGSIKVFRHALSLDEHRVKFIPTLWSHNDDKTDITPTTPSSAQSRPAKSTKPNPVQRLREKVRHGKKVIASPGGTILEKPGDEQSKDEKTPLRTSTVAPSTSSSSRAETNGPPPVGGDSSATGDGETAGDTDGTSPSAPIPPVKLDTDVYEVWFSGCHADVGGGSVPDGTAHSLSHITLRWMVREILATSTDILFDPAALARSNLTAHAAISFSTSPPPVSNGPANPDAQNLDSQDALTPIHDPLVLTKAWWILEYLPVKYAPTESTKTVIGLHRGRGRVVNGAAPNIHITVQERMNDPNLKYKPKATWKGTPNWVE